jgi:hypothetical protein
MDAKIGRVQSSGMKSVWLVAMTVACQRGADAYVEDVAHICDVMKLSGAEGMKNADARFVTAKWLGENLKTEEAHRFMVTLQPLDGAAKADALEAEAHRVGLAGCALAGEWRR